MGEGPGGVSHRGRMLSRLLGSSRVLLLSHEVPQATTGPALRSCWREPPRGPRDLLIRPRAALHLCFSAGSLRMRTADGHAVWLGTLLHLQQGPVKLQKAEDPLSRSSVSPQHSANSVLLLAVLIWHTQAADVWVKKRAQNRTPASIGDAAFEAPYALQCTSQAGICTPWVRLKIADGCEAMQRHALAVSLQSGCLRRLRADSCKHLAQLACRQPDMRHGVTCTCCMGLPAAPLPSASLSVAVAGA